uniref:Uncharacterized protein n=1 Tax=Meloidogyne enterolobii TaxID=390850 RepID=A0A6V7U1R2_MELEN|nr:unnamed protein product [Meloidogyne enterolobii]
MKEEEDKQQQNNSSPASFVLFDTNIASTSKIINTKIDVGPNVSSNFGENKNSFDNENEQNLKECGHKPIQNGVLNEIVQFAEENEKNLQEENNVDDKEETNNDGTKIEDAATIDDQNCFKTPALPCNKKSRPLINNNINIKKRCKLDVLNKNQQLKILQNKEISSIKYTNEELIREYVSIGKHSFVCPRSQQALAKKYPGLNLRKKCVNYCDISSSCAKINNKQNAIDMGEIEEEEDFEEEGEEEKTKNEQQQDEEIKKGEEEDLIKEIVIDEFSLLLFHSMDDFLLLKKHEDCLKQMEEDKKRKRRYEEAVRAGKIKKMGRKRKAENDLKREKKDNSEQRQLARLERKERRKREKEENRQRKNNKLIISTTATNENLPNNLSSISTNAASTPTPFANNICMDDDNDEENNGVNKTIPLTVVNNNNNNNKKEISSSSLLNNTSKNNFKT